MAGAGRRRVAGEGPGTKVPADISNQDPQLILRKRLRAEMEALRGLLRKAELLSGKTVGNGRAAARCGKDGRFLAAEHRSEATEAERTPCAKRRKTMPLAEIVVEPRMSADEISNLVARVASLSSNMPAHILEFLKEECTGHEDGNSGEIEIDLGSMRRSAMPELRKLLDEFAEGEKRRHQTDAASASRPISRSSPDQHEDGEIVVEEDDAIVDICVDASPTAAEQVLRSPPRLLEGGEIEEEAADMLVDICGDASPVATKTLAGPGNRPGSSSSSSSSSCSSGSSSDPSHSDSGDSGSDDESVTSSPAPAVLHNTSPGASPVGVPDKVLCSSPCSLEDGECRIEERGGAAAKFADHESVGGSLVPLILPERGDEPETALEALPIARDQSIPQATYRDLIARACQMLRRRRHPARQRAYEELEEMERNAKPIGDCVHPMHLRQLGITPVEHAVTSERRAPGRGSPVQRLLGLFLKAE
ncbi:hypothetical protein PAHAL_4G284100 [Panicum hallii]|jgi:hypothetical protein|uniref:NET domain-containing protein n=2 Tax=Panicum hallii TaxID=206008 RepID=A0A2T8JE95_9POAL|nr:hypothetical protein PAHAL_4G284100 [Panicum hallii]